MEKTSGISMRALRSIGVAAALLCAPLAQAATVTIDWQSGGTYGVFDPASGMPIGTIEGPAPVGQVTTRAGRFLGEIVATSDIAAEEFYLAPDHFFAYCHDLSEVLANSQYTVEFGASAAVLDFLGAVNSVLSPANSSPYDWIDPADKYVAGAVQLGIWEALYDSGFSLNGGSLTFGNALNGTMNATMLNHYNAFIGAMATSDSLDEQFVMRLTSTDTTSPTNRARPGTQDVITARFVPPQLLVPEPGTLALVGLAVVAAGLARRRR
jgi:hypothetical protein